MMKQKQQLQKNNKVYYYQLLENGCESPGNVNLCKEWN